MAEDTKTGAQVILINDSVMATLFPDHMVIGDGECTKSETGFMAPLLNKLAETTGSSVEGMTSAAPRLPFMPNYQRDILEMSYNGLFANYAVSDAGNEWFVAHNRVK